MAWTFPLLGFESSTLYRDEVLNVLSRAIETNPPDWMLINLYQYIENWFIRTSSEQVEVIKKVESILDSNPNLACFNLYPHYLQSDLHELEGDFVSSILENQRALELARTSDDVFLVMVLTGGLGLLLRNHNSAKALEYIEEYNRLSMNLGLTRHMELARNRMGVIHLVRGEYDMALECQFAAIEVYYHDTEPSSAMCTVISTHYSDIEDGRQALYWANESFRIAGGKGDVLMHSALSRALIHLERLDDADHHLNILHKLSLESAYEYDQADYLYGRGLYELKSGNPQTAIESLEQALTIYEQLNIQIGINRCLIALTQAEIQLAGESGSEDSSGSWMVRLESHARKKDYPGIQMHAALLRAEFLVKQGRKAEAQEVLQDALDILDSPTVKTLRTKIQKMLDDLIIA